MLGVARRRCRAASTRCCASGSARSRAEVRETLLHAALLHRPTLRELERAGRIGADDDVRRAVQSGLLARSEPGLRFTPSRAARRGRRRPTPPPPGPRCTSAWPTRRPTPAQRLRHLALADPRPDAELAHELGLRRPRRGRASGAREIAAELYLLAADRAPLDLAAERVEWLVAAIETAAPGNHVDLVQRALADVLEAHPTPGPGRAGAAGDPRARRPRRDDPRRGADRGAGRRRRRRPARGQGAAAARPDRADGVAPARRPPRLRARRRAARAPRRRRRARPRA